MKKTLIISLLLISFQFSFAQSSNYTEAMEAYKAEEYDKSLEYLDRELKDNPQHAEAYYYRAVIYRNKDKNALALTDINNSIKHLSPKETALAAAAYNVRGDIYQSLEKYENAIKDYTYGIKLLPKAGYNYLDRAQVYFELEQYDKAEADYSEVLKYDEGDVMAWAGIGRNYYYEKRYAGAEKILSQLIKLDPEYSYGFYYRALVYHHQKKYDEAIDDLFNCYLLDRSDSEVRDLFTTYAKENYRLAISKVTGQIKSKPAEGFWYFMRASLNFNQTYYQDALNDYTKALELYDEDYQPLILFNRGVCFSDAGMYGLAVKDFSEAISIDSTDATDFQYRADARRMLGDYAGSVSDFTKAIELEPTSAFSYYRRGWIKEEFQNDIEGGLKDYNKSISLDKDYPYTYLHRARLYESKLKSPEKAKLDYETILSLDTASSEGGNSRQYALFHLGRKEEAITWVNKIMQAYPTEGNYYDAACLYSLMNSQKEGIKYLNLAFENGFNGFTHLSVDNDLDNIRELPEFKSLVKEWKTRFEASFTSMVIGSPVAIEKEFKTVSIPMKPKGSGIYEIACKINDLPLNFIFDTGASDISISQTEANFMLKNGFLKSSDIQGKQRYMDANGDIEIGTKVLLRRVDFGTVVLENVSASIVNNKNAPLLFGQSALGKYGKIVIDNSLNTITISNR